MNIQKSGTLKVSVSSAFLLLFLVPAMAQNIGGQPGYWHHGWDTGHMVFGGFFMLLFWAGIIVAIFLAVRLISKGSSDGAAFPPNRNKARDILQERFARGEIDKSEYEERKKLLDD